MEHRHLRSVDLSCHHGVHRLSATRLSWPLGIHESLTLKSLEQIWNRIYWIYCLFEAFLCFDPFWSILNMAGAASPQRQPLERLLDRRMQSVWLPCYCGNNVRRFLPFWSILPFCHEGMDQYLLIPFLGGWTSIYQLFWCSPNHFAVPCCARCPLLSPQLPVWVSLAKQPEKHGFSLSFLLLSEYWQTESEFPKHAEINEPF